jgi:hypothetical protein
VGAVGGQSGIEAQPPLTYWRQAFDFEDFRLPLDFRFFLGLAMMLSL